MKARGDTGQIKKTEQALQELLQLRSEVTEMRLNMKAMLIHFSVVVPVRSASEEMERV
jgi:hypothetical protein